MIDDATIDELLEVLGKHRELASSIPEDDTDGLFHALEDVVSRMETILATGRGRAEITARSDDAKTSVDAWLDEIENFSTRSERLADDLARGADIRPWLEAAFALGAASVPTPDERPEPETSPSPV